MVKQQAAFTQKGPEWSFWFDTWAPPTPWSLSRQPRRIRAGWKKLAASALTTAVLIATGWGLLFHQLATERAAAVILGLAASAQLIRGFLWWEDFEFNRSVAKPLAIRMAAVHGMPAQNWRSWLTVPQDYMTRADGLVAQSDVPPDFTGAERDMEDLTRAVSVSTGIESPNVDKILKSHRPRLAWYRSDPPPDLVTWEQIKEHVYAARADEFVIGIGKKGSIVKVSRQLDAPHLMIDCGSGAGKSNLAAFLMLQALIRGGWGLFLDAKLTSHPYVYKDMDAEFDQLPNAGYARRIPVMHDALMWLGNELARRYTLTERYVNAKGDMLGRSVGPPIFVVAEELNLATPQIKEDWAARRAVDKDLPKKSPALQALGALAFAGRAVDMHLIVIGQQLTAETLGTSGSQGGAVRRNMGIKLLARYDPNGWKMQAGDIPMPPSPTVPGRVQCLAGGDIRETQVPFVIERDDLRDLAASGTVVPVPPDMPGGPGTALPSLPVPAELTQAQGSAEQGLSVGRPTFRPPGTATLKELAAAGFYYSHDAAKKASTRDPDHPAGVGWDGSAKLYEISAVADYKAGKARKVRAIR